MQVATHSGLGIYVNEMQRTINGNGLGCGGGPCAPNGYYDARIIPYGHLRSYRPSDARGLGDVPNDFEASVDLQYIPVRQGWYYGYPVDGRGYPDARGGLGRSAFGQLTLGQHARLRRMRRGLGDGAATVPVTATPAPGSAEDLQQLAKLERTQTILQAISTISIATVAVLAVAKAVVSIRQRTFGRRGDD